MKSRDIVPRPTPLILALVCVALLSGLTAELSGQQHLLSLIFGINVNQVSTKSARALQYLKPEMVRLDGFSWDLAAAQRGTLDFSSSDKVMQWARENNLRVLGIIQYAPGWATGKDFTAPKQVGISSCGIPDLESASNSFHELRVYPPKQNLDFRPFAFTPNTYLDFANYARATAQRYADVTYWQIWNEPNNPIFWPTGPSAEEYTRVLKVVSEKVKEGNPNAKIVLGGISLNDLEYIDALYAAGAKNYFDIMAVHLYNPSQSPSAYLDNELERLHEAMIRNGDDDKSIWLTEIGWYTGDSKHSASQRQQARYLQQAYDIANAKSYVGAMFWNTLLDCDTGYDSANPEHNYGVFMPDWTPKRAASVFRGILLQKQ
jgi:hypothetical protein